MLVSRSAIQSCAASQINQLRVSYLYKQHCVRFLFDCLWKATLWFLKCCISSAISFLFGSAAVNKKRICCLPQPILFVKKLQFIGTSYQLQRIKWDSVSTLLSLSLPIWAKKIYYTMKIASQISLNFLQGKYNPEKP